MGGDQGDFLGIHHFDGGTAGNGQCLFLSGEDWLPLAVSPQGFRPLGNGEMVVRSVSRRWNLGGSVQPLDPGRAQGHASEPSTGIMDSQSVVSAPQKGDRGFDGNKKIKGMKRHILTCSLGFILAVIVTAANVHDTKVVDALLERATENGWSLERVNVDGIYVGPTVDAAAQRHGQGNRLSRDEIPHWQDSCLTPGPRQWSQSGKLLTSRPFFA